MLKVDGKNFDAEVLQSKQPVLVDFWAEWCGPCHMIAPTVAALAEEHPEITVAKCNVDEAPDLAMRYRISGIPTLMLFKDGEAAGMSVGVREKDELEEFLKG